MARFAPAASSRTSLSEDTAEIMSSWLRHVSTRRPARTEVPRPSRASRSSDWDDHRRPCRLDCRYPMYIQNASGQIDKRLHHVSAGGEASRNARPFVCLPAGLPRPVPFASSSRSLLTGSVASSEDSSSSVAEAVSWRPALCLAVTALAATIAVVAVALGVSHVVVGSAADEYNTEDDRMQVQNAPYVNSPEGVHADAPVTAPANSSKSASRLLPKVGPLDSDPEAPATFGAPLAAWSPTVEDVFAFGKRPPNASVNSGGESEGRHMCDGVFSTYCARAPTQFHYDRDTGTCVQTAQDSAQLCNQSPNRFASKAECAQTCVHSFTPEEKCFDTPVFAQCGSKDVNATFWHFTGRTCSAWPYPRGLCPANDARTFPSFDACLERCVRRPLAEPPCQPLRPGDVRACAVGELRHPYFADGAGEHVRCLAVSVARFGRHRCLVGTNRFASKAACLRACLPRPSEGALGLGLK
ncbi:uncharacterized protein LOC144102592 [Amblyomma americanum]